MLSQSDISNFELKKISLLELESAIITLYEAFQNDPCLRYLLYNLYPEREAKLIHAYVLKTGIKFGHAFSSSEKMEGVAVWLPPESIKLSILQFIKLGGLKIPLKNILRLNTYDLHAKKIHSQAIKTPHWYLFSIGVHPACQGKSFGTKLLTPMLNYFDKTKQNCYLETHNRVNINFYEKNGFNLISTTTLPGSNTEQSSMLRNYKS